VAICCIATLHSHLWLLSNEHLNSSYLLLKAARNVLCDVIVRISSAKHAICNATKRKPEVNRSWRRGPSASRGVPTPVRLEDVNVSGNGENGWPRAMRRDNKNH